MLASLVQAAPLATVGRYTITESDITARLRTAAPTTTRAAMLDQLINEAVLLNRAHDLGLHETERYQQALERVSDRLLMTLLFDAIPWDKTVSPAAIQAFYDENPDLFAPLEQRRYRYYAAETRAEATRMAAIWQADPLGSHADIQDGGWIMTATTPVHAAVFALEKIGMITGPIATETGYELIQLNGRVITPPQPATAYTDMIRAEILTQRQQDAIRAYTEAYKPAYMR